MASTWACSDGHTHDLASTTDQRSVGGVGRECKTCGDRITGETYASAAVAPQTQREWTASTRLEGPPA